MATISEAEKLPPTLEADSEPPTLFDGTIRLYMAYTCPFAQRPWITRNFKGLQDKIELVPLNLQSRPTWYKDKVNPENKVPALEHDSKVLGESLDLIKYINDHFEGPSLYPDDVEKKQFGEDMLAYTDKFNSTVFGSFKGGETVKEVGAAFDYIENALQKFSDGPFFLGDKFSLVDIAYVPFIERFQLLLSDVWKYDITEGRPKLAAWVQEVNKIEAYTQTKYPNPEEHLNFLKKRFLPGNAGV